jgi:glycosyltransferase involved in cell wall biosynthesis
MRSDLTLLIVARNAAATIERALLSCLTEPDCPIVLVDDFSRDDTVARARSIAGSGLRVLTSPPPGGVGLARQRALDAVETEYAAWLDADDQWIAGRAGRLVRMLEDGADVATESIDLIDGETGVWRRRLTVPSFVRGRAGALRLFERNFLPGDTQVAFRTQVFRDAGGYDPAIRGPESFDLLLRAIRLGARLAAGDEVGYRMFAYPGSLSRNLDRQRAALTLTLRKHSYTDVHRMYLDAGYPGRIASWALVMLAQYRGESSQALAFLDDASPRTGDQAEILEPEGPWPFEEGWRRAFHRGTLLLQEGDALLAAAELGRAEELNPTAEGANNLGVAFARLGYRNDARAAFDLAGTRFPGYVDARLNREAQLPAAITTHPLRRIASRSEYDAA